MASGAGCSVEPGGRIGDIQGSARQPGACVADRPEPRSPRASETWAPLLASATGKSRARHRENSFQQRVFSLVCAARFLLVPPWPSGAFSLHVSRNRRRRASHAITREMRAKTSMSQSLHIPEREVEYMWRSTGAVGRIRCTPASGSQVRRFTGSQAITWHGYMEHSTSVLSVYPDRAHRIVAWH